MAESSIKIEITGEAATALAKLPELIHQSTRHRLERQEHRDREERLREEAEQDRLEKRAAEADERRQQHIVSVLGIVTELVKAYLFSKEGDDPQDQESVPDAVLVHLRNELLLLAPRTKVGVLPLNGVLQILKFARPEWLPLENVGRILAIMQQCTDLRDAGDLLDALGEDTEVHREAIKVLDAAFDIARKRTDPGFMCMDCGARQVDPKTHHEECKEHEDKLESGPEDGPVSDMDFVIAVCSLVGLNASASPHLIDSLDLVLGRLSNVLDPGMWDYADLAGVILKIDRYMSGPIPASINKVLTDEKNARALRVLTFAVERRRKLAAGGSVEDDLDFPDQEFINAVCRLAPAPGNLNGSLEESLRSLSAVTGVGAPFVDPEYPDNLNRIAHYLDANVIHPIIKELLERPEFQVAYERLKRAGEQIETQAESA